MPRLKRVRRVCRLIGEDMEGVTAAARRNRCHPATGARAATAVMKHSPYHGLGAGSTRNVHIKDSLARSRAPARLRA
jgi:hypothetical protein